jgi:hypothetical protein
LGSGYPQQHIVILAQALLGLQLHRHEVRIHMFEIVDAGKGHLPSQLVTKPLTADHIAQDSGSFATKEHTSIEHRLDGEALT